MHNPGKHYFNVGTGKGVSVLDAIKVFEKVNSIKLNYTIGNRRSGDVEQIYSDNTLVKKELDWEAKQDLEQAMIDAWNWEKKK